MNTYRRRVNLKKLFCFVIILLFGIGLFFNKAYTEQNMPDVSWHHPTQIRTYIQPNHKYTDKMKRACHRWSVMTHNGIIFKYESFSANAQIKVIFVKSIPPEFNIDSAAGLTRYSYSLNNGQFRNAEIYIADYTKYGKLTDDEVFTSMLHELGHAIGLGHSNNPESIMYPNTSKVKTMEISKEDLDLLAKKYNWK